MDFLIHWPPGPVVATVQCQGLQIYAISVFFLHKWPFDFKCYIMGNSTVTRVTFLSIGDTKISFINHILLFSNPSFVCC